MFYPRIFIGLMALLCLVHGGCQDKRTAQDGAERLLEQHLLILHRVKPRK